MRFALPWRGGLAVWFLIAGCGAGNLEQVAREVRRDFPNVSQLTTSELASWLRDSTRSPPMILDVRAPAEYAVSHLLNAHQVTPGASIEDALLAVDRATSIVAYCSVGYRSSRFVERLQAAGFTDVYNLEGSIFAWANEGRLVVRNDQAVDEVHPYNRNWGRLLDSRYRSDAVFGGVLVPAAAEGK